MIFFFWFFLIFNKFTQISGCITLSFIQKFFDFIFWNFLKQKIKGLFESLFHLLMFLLQFYKFFCFFLHFLSVICYLVIFYACIHVRFCISLNQILLYTLEHCIYKFIWFLRSVCHNELYILFNFKIFNGSPEMTPI